MKKKKENSFSNCVGISEEYWNKFNSYYSSREAEKISQMLNNRTTPFKPNAGTYRQINFWDHAGLIDINRKGASWRKYSIVDSVWLNIIAELRSFDLSIEKILVTKETLEEKANKRSPMPLLEFSIFRALMEKEQIHLLVFQDGSAIPLSISEYKLNLASGELKNHIHINVNEILKRQFENNKRMITVYDEVFNE